MFTESCMAQGLSPFELKTTQRLGYRRTDTGMDGRTGGQVQYISQI